MAQNDPRQTLAELGEFALIDQITAGLELGGEVVLGPGDDAALIELGSGPLVTSIDVLVEGVHFRRDWSEAEHVGRKAVAVNVADIEAMGGRTVGLVMGFSAPGDLESAWALDFARGVRAECAAAGVSLVGGDVTRSRDVTISVTVFGVLGSARAVTRSGARPGDVVAMVGRLGWAAAGLVVLGRGFRSPRVVVEAQRVPQVPYGQGILAAEAGATSMIDISDGLLGDLGHIADASQVIIDLRTEAFEIPEPLQAVAAATGSNPLKLILTGGEDHALVATFGGELPAGWTAIGTVKAVDNGEAGVLVDGAVWEGEAGFDHFGRR